MKLERGVLVVKSPGKAKLPSIQVRIGEKTFNPAQAEVSQSVLDHLSELDGKEVEFEWVSGQPKKVREVGGNFVPPHTGGRSGEREFRGVPSRGRADRRPPARQQAQAEKRPSRASSDRSDQRVSRPAGERSKAPTHPRSQPFQNERSASRTRDFHNPYNFVPAPPRPTDDADLGDRPPVEQDRFDPKRYAGRIRVRMTAKTPLLVPDTENYTEHGRHRTYPLRRDASGKPLIPSSSVRGMLRSAYEIVTNSRFGRFAYEQHRDRLAFRMAPKDGLRLIPARVHDGKITLLTGTSRVAVDGSPERGDPMYAAWLCRYDRDGRTNPALSYHHGGELPRHGDEVECWLELVQHWRWDKHKHVDDFKYWSVRKIVRAGDALGDKPRKTQSHEKRDGRAWHQPLDHEMKKVRGWVCITNPNINRKHDERVFFAAPGGSAPEPFEPTVAHRSQWRELIQNYQTIHREELDKRNRNEEEFDRYYGPDPGKTAWSRHVYTEADRELEDGALCYARLSQDRTAVEALFPVMISRELYRTSPWDLLHKSLRPATSINELSPADRVFGWVRPNGDSPAALSSDKRVAARGLLRVGPVRCESSVEESREIFAPPGIPLAILSTPKPQQGRFYVARSHDGEAQRDGLTKTDAGYSPRKGLRGRKVYPYQRSLPPGHWDHPERDSTPSAKGNSEHYQEYRRPGGERDDQNRSFLGWVKPGAVFTFELHMHNLSTVELGAILWLLTLSDDHDCFFRFGGGKPLGFGSVRLTIDECDVRTGDELRSRYTGWHTDGQPVDPRETAIPAFWDALSRAYPPADAAGGFDDIPFIKAFRVACKGFDDDLPIRYPRATTDGQPGPPDPKGESFQWFVANEQPDARYALLDLHADRGLPTLPIKRGADRSRRRERE